MAFIHGVIGGVRQGTLKDLKRSLENPDRDRVSRLRYALPDISEVVDVIVVSSEEQYEIEAIKSRRDELEAYRIEEILEEVYGGQLDCCISIVNKSKKRKRGRKKKSTVTFEPMLVE